MSVLIRAYVGWTFGVVALVVLCALEADVTGLWAGSILLVTPLASVAAGIVEEYHR